VTDLSAEEVMALITGMAFTLCIPLGIAGGLVTIWVDPVTGNKMVESAILVGVPSLILAMIYYEDDSENSDKKTSEEDG
jgi:hypothetical protein